MFGLPPSNNSIGSAMRLIFSLKVMAPKLSVRAVGLFLLCALACLSPSSRASAQGKQQESGSPVVTLTGNSTEWGGGPDGSYSRTEVTAPDGSSLTVYDYLYRSEKGFKAGLKNCTNYAFSVVEDSVLPRTKKRRAGRRTLVLTRDSEGREGAVLCRSENKRMLTVIYGNTTKNVLGFERTLFPK